MDEGKILDAGKNMDAVWQQYSCSLQIKPNS